MKTSNRKTRSDKFPLTLHPTGQYCKKIRGKIFYFGSDKNRHSRVIWIRQHFYMDMMTMYRKQLMAI